MYGLSPNAPSETPVETATGEEVHAAGLVQGKEAEVAPATVRTYSRWKLAELAIYIGLATMAVYDIFRADKARVHVPITSLHTSNVGDWSKLEYARVFVKDIPIAYWAFLAAVIKIVFSFAQIPGMGSGAVMLHVWLNQPQAKKNSNVASPIDRLGLVETSLVWPLLYLAAIQLNGVSDWQIILQAGALAYVFSLYVLELLLYRYENTQLFQFVPAVVAFAFAFVWSLVDTHSALHEGGYPTAFFVYSWMFIVLTALFVLLAAAVRSFWCSAGYLLWFNVFFHLAAISTLTISSFVVAEKNL